jgi:hypothetical protein
MIEIQLPCCDETVHVATLDDPIRCDRCGIDFELDDPTRDVALAAA